VPGSGESQAGTLARGHAGTKMKRFFAAKQADLPNLRALFRNWGPSCASEGERKTKRWGLRFGERRAIIGSTHAHWPGEKVQPSPPSNERERLASPLRFSPWPAQCVCSPGLLSFPSLPALPGSSPSLHTHLVAVPALRQAHIVKTQPTLTTFSTTNAASETRILVLVLDSLRGRCLFRARSLPRDLSDHSTGPIQPQTACN
jgi:hypothetical protein